AQRHVDLALEQIRCGESLLHDDLLTDLDHAVAGVGVAGALPESDRGKGWGMDDRLRTTRPELGPALHAPRNRGEGVRGAVREVHLYERGSEGRTDGVVAPPPRGERVDRGCDERRDRGTRAVSPNPLQA